jgi:hypothetical protein
MPMQFNPGQFEAAYNNIFMVPKKDVRPLAATATASKPSATATHYNATQQSNNSTKEQPLYRTYKEYQHAKQAQQLDRPAMIHAAIDKPAVNQSTESVEAALNGSQNLNTHRSTSPGFALFAATERTPVIGIKSVPSARSHSLAAIAAANSTRSANNNNNNNFTQSISNFNDLQCNLKRAQDELLMFRHGSNKADRSQFNRLVGAVNEAQQAIADYQRHFYAQNSANATLDFGQLSQTIWSSTPPQRIKNAEELSALPDATHRSANSSAPTFAWFKRSHYHDVSDRFSTKGKKYSNARGDNHYRPLSIEEQAIKNARIAKKKAALGGKFRTGEW